MKLRKQLHLQLCQKEENTLGINLTKNMKDENVENYKTLMKKLRSRK